MTEEFSIETVAAGARSVVLRVRGRLDARSAPELFALSKRLATEGRSLVLNLKGVSFIASSGVGALLALVEDYHQTAHIVRLAEVSPAVDSVIRLLNLDQFLTIDASEHDAVAALEAA